MQTSNRLPVVARSRRLSASVAVVVEPLERRQLLSAVLANGVLTVAGTAAADTIEIDATFDTDANGNPELGVTATLNGTAQSFDATAAQPIASVVVNAGDGNDTVSFKEGVFDYPGTPELAVSLSGGAGADMISAGELSGATDAGPLVVTMSGGDGNDTLVAGDYPLEVDATMYGNAGDDLLSTAGLDTRAAMYGGDGNDSFVNSDPAGSDSVTVSGGTGTDTILLSQTGEAFADPPGGTIDMNAPTNTVPNFSAGGSLPAPYTVEADVENVTGDASSNGRVLTVVGNALNNVIDVGGNGGPVSVSGGDGNDSLTVYDASSAALNGGNGNDTLAGSAAYGQVNHFSGGPGTDLVDYSAYTAGVTVHLDGSAPSGTAARVAAGDGDTFDGTVEQVAGSNFNDVLFGTKGNNAFFANGGDDVIVTDGGTDAAFGDAGNDTVYADDGGATYVDGGTGTNTAYVDPTGDTTTGVQTVVRRRNGVALPAPTKLTGTTFGTAGSYANGGNTVAKATDDNLATYFDGPTANGDVVGIDLGSAKAVTQIGFAPRVGYETRMLGGVFQASNSATFASGVVTAYTVTGTPETGSLSTAGEAVGSYRYWRYVAPNGSYGNIAEFELFSG